MVAIATAQVVVATMAVAADAVVVVVFAAAVDADCLVDSSVVYVHVAVADAVAKPLRLLRLMSQN